MPAITKSRNSMDSKALMWIGIVVLAFGVGLLIGTFNGAFELYDQVEPLILSEEITQAQGQAIAQVPETMRSIMFFSAALVLLGILVAAVGAIRTVR